MTKLRFSMAIPTWLYWSVVTVVALFLVVGLLATHWGVASQDTGILLLLWGMKAGWWEEGA